MWQQILKRLIAVGGMWGPLSAIAGIFTLGCSLTVFLFERFDQLPRADDVKRDVASVDGRISRVVEYVNHQDAEIRQEQKLIQQQVLDQYAALNTRLDTQNQLIMQAIRGRGAEAQPVPGVYPAYVSNPRSGAEKTMAQ